MTCVAAVDISALAVQEQGQGAKAVDTKIVMGNEG